jgi:hypothetical protein
MSLPPAVVEQLDQLQLPDVRRLERMPCLPAWVASRIACGKIETQPDRTTGKWREVLTLPTNLILKVREREMIEQHVTQLQALCNRTPENNAEAQQETLRALTKLMLVLPSTTQNELSAEARGEAYLDALDDVAPWAVRSAIRRWQRGECALNPQGKPYDYHWCPAPAELRRVAMTELWHVKSRAEKLKQLLCAAPLIEFSDEHCASMRARIALVLSSSTARPVGSNGSGGAVGAS